MYARGIGRVVLVLNARAKHLALVVNMRGIASSVPCVSVEHERDMGALTECNREGYGESSYLG
jgi:hypothetical protein